MKQALEVMCTEYNMTGVLVATKSKVGARIATKSRPRHAPPPPPPPPRAARLMSRVPLKALASIWGLILGFLSLVDFCSHGAVVYFQDGKKACTIPPSCEGKILQTTFLDQRDFYVFLTWF